MRVLSVILLVFWAFGPVYLFGNFLSLVLSVPYLEATGSAVAQSNDRGGDDNQSPDRDDEVELELGDVIDEQIDLDDDINEDDLIDDLPLDEDLCDLESCDDDPAPVPGNQGDRGGDGNQGGSLSNLTTDDNEDDDGAWKAPGQMHLLRNRVATPPAALTGWEAPQPEGAADAPQIAYSAGRSGADFRENELAVVGLSPQIREILTSAGFQILSEKSRDRNGVSPLARIKTPAGLTTQRALARARDLLPGVGIELVSLYSPAAGGQSVPVRYGPEMVGLVTEPTCSKFARIGLIDTGLARHPTLNGISVTRKKFVSRGQKDSVIHGTAIASMLVGNMPGVGPLLPEAKLYSANVFAYENDNLRSDVFSIVEALEWLDRQNVKVVNMSLMGPANPILKKAVDEAMARGQIIIAAAGNFGPGSPPVYPAAYDSVISVAAVDYRNRPYRRNNRGDYLDISAPGVDIWGADARGKGAAFWTGTSFAVPFATAVVARDVAEGRVHNVAEARKRLIKFARDMGAPGRDPIYGYGLLRSPGCN